MKSTDKAHSYQRERGEKERRGTREGRPQYPGSGKEPWAEGIVGN